MICWCSGSFVLLLLQGYILKKKVIVRIDPKIKAQIFFEKIYIYCSYSLPNSYFFYCRVKVWYVFLLIQCRDIFYCDGNTIISSFKTCVYSSIIIVCLFEDSGWRKCHTDCVHYIYSADIIHIVIYIYYLTYWKKKCSYVYY